MDVSRKMRIWIIIFILLSLAGIGLAIYPLLAPIRSEFAQTFTSKKWGEFSVNNRITTMRSIVISAISFGILFGTISLIMSIVFLVGQYRIMFISQKWWFLLIALTIIAFVLGIVATALTMRFLHSTMWIYHSWQGY